MIAFDQTYHWVLIVLVLVWIVGIFLDFKYRVKNMRWIRLLLWTVVSCTIALFFLKPYQYRPKTAIKAAVVSKSHSTDSIKKAGYTIIQESSDLFSNTFSELLLLDTGLADWELRAIQSDQIITSFQTPKGLLDYQHESSLLQGKKAQVSIISNFDEACTLHFFDGTQLVDSINIEPGKKRSTFGFTPKAAGNFTYQIAAISRKDTLAKEVVPFTVSIAQQPTILMLQSNPNFEARFIKNYLGDFGYAVNSRTRISKDLFNDEFVNTSRKKLNRLSANLLEPIQLIVLDKQAFSLLSAGERRLIKDLNRTGNLGLLLINTSPSEMNGIWTSAPMAIENDIELDGVKLTNQTIAGFSPILNKELPIGYYQKNGIGKIGILTVQNLYQLALQGNQSTYKQVVKNLTEALLPYQKSSEFIQMSKAPRINENTTVRFTSTSAEPKILINDYEHPVRESAFREGLYETEFWSNKEGWNSLEIVSDSISYDFYTFSETDWASKKSNELLESNKLFAQTHSGGSESISIQIKQYWPKWIYLTVIILGLGFLWAEQRFLNP